MFEITIPLNRKIKDGIIERDKALSLLFLFHNNIQNNKYKKQKLPLTIK